MTIPELIKVSQEEIDLTEQIMQTLIRDIKDYPQGNYTPSKLTRLEYLYETLRAINDVLAQPIH